VTEARPPGRARRPPPPFVPVTVAGVEPLGDRLTRVHVTGDVARFAGIEPAASLRVLLPEPDGLEIPDWNGNEFLLTDGRRPGIRTLTPGTLAGDTMALDVVMHGEGRLPAWAATARPDSPLALSGPGSGYHVDSEAPAYLLGGDETAVPAIGQLLGAIPGGVPVAVVVEARPGAAPRWPERPSTSVRTVPSDPDAPPGAALVATIATTEIAPAARVWVAGEAAAVQRVRKDLLEGRGVPRAHCTIRGYWKHGRAGT